MVSKRSKIDFEKPAIASQSRVFLSKPNAARPAAINESKSMKVNFGKVPTRFAPGTRFELRPAPLAPFRATVETEFDRLRNRLLRQQLEEVTTPELNAGVRRAANEAAALAWVTGLPLLVFPALFEEKAKTERVRATRQEGIRERSRELLVA